VHGCADVSECYGGVVAYVYRERGNNGDGEQRGVSLAIGWWPAGACSCGIVLCFGGVVNFPGAAQPAGFAARVVFGGGNFVDDFACRCRVQWRWRECNGRAVSFAVDACRNVYVDGVSYGEECAGAEYFPDLGRELRIRDQQ
jgi:hypothetical protein